MKSKNTVDYTYLWNEEMNTIAKNSLRRLDTLCPLQMQLFGSQIIFNLEKTVVCLFLNFLFHLWKKKDKKVLIWFCKNMYVLLITLLSIIICKLIYTEIDLYSVSLFMISCVLLYFVSENHGYIFSVEELWDSVIHPK